MKKAPIVFPSSDANLSLSSGKHQTPNPPKSQTTLSKSGSKKKFTSSGKSDTRNQRSAMSQSRTKNTNTNQGRQSQGSTQPKNAQGGISSMNLQQLNKSVSQRNIEHPSSILPGNNLQTPVVHANLSMKDDNIFDMRTGSLDNNRNITKVGHANRAQGKQLVASKKGAQSQAPAQRQKQGQVVSGDYPGLTKNQHGQG
jgi:hypothetical protein